MGHTAGGFMALGQPHRLQLMRDFVAAGDAGLSAGTAAGNLGVSPSTLSFHLRVLEQSGLIVQERQGRSVVYRAVPDRLQGLLADLERLSGAPALRRRSGTKARRAEHFTVLFVCTRNSARSVMAEAILNQLAPGRFTAHSAGSQPSRSGPMPEVVQHLKALGHDTSTLRSKSWEEFVGEGKPAFDFVIALCDTVRGQACPEFGAGAMTAAWPLPDPAKFTGSVAERATLLNELYAMLRRRLEIFVNLPIATLDRMALKARIDELAQPLVVATR